jgi:hypothetical protein
MMLRPRAQSHDVLTVAAIACAAFITADLSHEALGHGVVAHLMGAKELVLSYTYLSSDVQSPWISVAGPFANIVEGLLAFAVLRRVRLPAAAMLFVFLLMNFNLLDAGAYLIYSGILNSGDLAVVIAGLPHLGAIRLAMLVAGLMFYAGFVVLGAQQVRRFASPQRLLVTIAYVAALGLNCAAAAVNPLGLKYFLLSGLPATAGANAGLFAMPGLTRRFADGLDGLTVGRSYVWIGVGLLLAIGFVAVIGPGVTLSHAGR